MANLLRNMSQEQLNGILETTLEETLHDNDKFMYLAFNDDAVVVQQLEKSNDEVIYTFTHENHWKANVNVNNYTVEQLVELRDKLIELIYNMMSNLTKLVDSYEELC